MENVSIDDNDSDLSDCGCQNCDGRDEDNRLVEGGPIQGNLIHLGDNRILRLQSTHRFDWDTVDRTTGSPSVI